MTTPRAASSSTSSKPNHDASRALQLAILPIASLAMTGCLGTGGGLGFSPAAPEDPAALQRVEDTIARSRGIVPSSATPPNASPAGAGILSGDASSKSAAYVASIDAALAAQPAAAAKIEQIKATGQLAPTAKTPSPAELAEKFLAPGEAKPKPASTPVILASGGNEAVKKTELKADPRPVPKLAAVAPEPKAEPKAEVALALTTPKAAPEPKPILASEAAKGEKTETGEKIEKASGAALATFSPEPKATTAAGTSAMGAMAVANGGQVVVADDPAPAPADATPALGMDAIVAQLRRQVAANPRQLNVALALQLLETAGPDAKPSAALSALPETDQKLVVDLASAVGAAMQAPAAAGLAEKAAPIAALATKWDTDADLKLPKLVLASRVDSYGVYNAVEPKFENGKRHTVIIYCEVANFSAKKGDDGWFTTKLAQQDSLITEDGLLVWRPNPEEVEDRSRNQRRDFYLVKKLTLPETLAIGKYTLRMSVTDKQTNKISMVSIPVEIVAK